jgi:uncharacterized protein (DUF1697 family)
VTSQYVALLRGINVGGKSIIKMVDLKARLDAAGFANVATYIQSGNVLFEAPKTDPDKLADKMNVALKSLGYKAPTVVFSYDEMKAVVTKAPKGFGSDLAKYRCDVFFLKSPLTPQEVVAKTSLKEGVDAIAAGPGVVYFWRVAAKAAQSRVNRMAVSPMYQNMTIRNWNTTTKLLALMDAR